MMIGFFWLAFAIIVGVAANTRGRNGFVWFGIAALISPLLAGLLVLALGYKTGPIQIAGAAPAAQPISVGNRVFVAAVVIAGFAFLIYVWG